MPLIEILDGTRDTLYGNALKESFAEIAKYQRILLTPGIGIIDIKGFNMVKNAEKAAYNSERDQVNIYDMLNYILNNTNRKTKNTFILTEKDLYREGINWCFGSTQSDSNGGTHIILSTYRLKNLTILSHIGTHELGHMFKAASPGRNNTEIKLGSHCINDCVMQQKLTVPEMNERAHILEQRKDKFCYDCQSELRNYKG